MVTLRNKINKLLKLQILNNNTFKVRHHEIADNWNIFTTYKCTLAVKMLQWHIILIELMHIGLEKMK